MNWKHWFHGLFSAIIGGGASAGSAWMGMAAAKQIGIDVPELNLNAVGIIFATGGITSMFAYLKQSPLPAQPKNPSGPRSFFFPFFSLVLALALVASVAGCRTTQNAEGGTRNTDIEKTAAIVQMSAQLATYSAIRYDANAREYFEVAAGVITLLAQHNQFDPDRLQNALSDISIKELRRDDAAVALAAAVNVYRIFLAEKADSTLEKSVYARPVMVALASGIRQGLNARQTAETYGLAR